MTLTLVSLGAGSHSQSTPERSRCATAGSLHLTRDSHRDSHAVCSTAAAGLGIWRSEQRGEDLYVWARPTLLPLGLP